MADPQDQPDGEPDGAPTPPEKKPPAEGRQEEPQKRRPRKRRPKRRPRKKRPPRRPRPKAPSPHHLSQPSNRSPMHELIETNGQLAAAAKDAAAQAKSTVEAANNPVPSDIMASSPSQSRVPLIVAVTLSLLAILLIRQLRRR